MLVEIITALYIWRTYICLQLIRLSGILVARQSYII